MGLANCSAVVASKPACIPPVPYSAASQTQAAAERNALPATAELRRYLEDYAAERAALRAVCGSR